jgi:FtsH-binding integral membrane protein
MAFRDPFANPSQGYSRSQAAVGFDAGLRSYMLRIYNYMASALALTGIVALAVASTPALMSMFFVVHEGHAGLSGLGWVVLIAPLGLVMWLNMGLAKMNTATAQAIFWAFAVLMGLSLAPIFLAYTGASISLAFFSTAATFGAVSLYGYTTKKDLTGMGHFMRMGLFGLIIASLLNIFLQSSGLNWALSCIGVVVFTGLTAYDTQKLKSMYYQIGGTGSYATKMAIMGALSLYLDFINMFMMLLRLMGDRR